MLQKTNPPNLSSLTHDPWGAERGSCGAPGWPPSMGDSGVQATCTMLVHHLKYVVSSSLGQEERGQGELVTLKYLLATTSYMPLAPTISRLGNLGEHVDIW